MLLRLRIRNLAIIDDLALDFDPGFNCLTGETGAGKSIIVGALQLVLGERASSDDVRGGCDTAEVEALFDITGHAPLATLLDKAGIDRADDELILRREISAAGRSRALANGNLLPLAQLRQIGDLLVDLHGQHQHQSLLDVERHREVLDRFGGAPLAAALQQYRDLYHRHKTLSDELRRLDRQRQDFERQRDLLDYQLDEIRQADPRPGEDDELEAERRRLENAEALGHAAHAAYALLYENPGEEPAAEALLRRASEELHAAARLDTGLKPQASRLQSLLAETADLAAELRHYAEDIEHDPARLETVLERLESLKRLKRKYGQTLEDVLAEAERLQAERDRLAHSDARRREIQAELQPLAAQTAQAALALGQARAQAAQQLADGLVRQLKELEMPRLRFEARLEHQPLQPDEDNPDALSLELPDGRRCRAGAHGLEQVEFLFSPNPGEPLRPLRKIASGGELSRVMLGLKALLHSADTVPTLVFDEIDAGISGKTGRRIGEKMQALAAHRQILSVSHLAQIAARADRHYRVRKIHRDGRTLTRLDALQQQDRIEELARLLGGADQSQAARAHAAELLEEAKAPR